MCALVAGVQTCALPISLSFEIARDGVTINVLLPGRIATDRMEQLYRNRAAAGGMTVAEAKRRVAETIPARRAGRVDEFAALAGYTARKRVVEGTAWYVRGDTGGRSLLTNKKRKQ